MATSTRNHLLRFSAFLVGVIVVAAIVTVVMLLIADHDSNSSDSSTNKTGTRVTDSLRFVAIVSRHGNRGSTTDYPGDLYLNNDTRYWPYGLLGLTPRGRTEMYNLGVKVRSLYNGFLNSTFHSEEVHASSTYMDRLLMSGESFLAGLYPPKGFQVWNKDIAWQPSAIYSDSPDKTITIQTECARFNADFVSIITELPDIYASNISQMGDYYNSVTGSNDTGSAALTDLYSLWDKLICEDAEGFAIPEWTKTIYPEPLKDLIAKMYIAYFAGTDEMVRLLIGGLFGEVVEAMLGKVNGTITDRRLQYYSGHDSSLVALQVLLGIPRDSIIGLVLPGSAMLLELHEDNVTTGQYSIQALYIDGNSTTLEPVSLTIPNCGHRPTCDFYTFVNNTFWFTDFDYEQECLNLTSSSSSLTNDSHNISLVKYII